MKKMNNKGFMLTETLIVSTLVITVLLVIYVQFRSINRSINNSYEYDTVNSLYSLYNVKLYIEQEKYTSIVARLDMEDYVDLTNCSPLYFNTEDYCTAIISKTGIKQLIATKENLYSLVEESPFDEKFNDYISTIKYSTGDGYRLIASYNDGTYASVRILNDTKFDSIIANACVLSVEKSFTINHLLEDGVLFREPTISKSGCSSTVDVTRYRSYLNSCYYATSYSNTTITISEDELLNEATIYYSRYPSSLTIHYKTTSGTTLASDVVLSGNCGATYQPEQYKKTFENYNYSNTTATEITLGSSDAEVTLYYTEGSGSDE